MTLESTSPGARDASGERMLTPTPPVTGALLLHIRERTTQVHETLVSQGQLARYMWNVLTAIFVTQVLMVPVPSGEAGVF